MELEGSVLALLVGAFFPTMTLGFGLWSFEESR